MMRGCSIEGCERPHDAKGLCHRHYQLFPELRRDSSAQTCSTSGCVELVAAETGFCRSCLIERLPAGIVAAMGWVPSRLEATVRSA